MGTRAIVYIGEVLIWQPLPNSPIRQIKNLASFPLYSILELCLIFEGYIILHVHFIAIYSTIHVYTFD